MRRRLWLVGAGALLGVGVGVGAVALPGGAPVVEDPPPVVVSSPDPETVLDPVEPVTATMAGGTGVVEEPAGGELGDDETCMPYPDPDIFACRGRPGCRPVPEGYCAVPYPLP